jgi:hypothetical protein
MKMSMIEVYPREQLKRRMARAKAQQRAKQQPKLVIGYDERKAAVAGIALFVELEAAKGKNVLVREKIVRKALEPFGVGELAVQRVMGIPKETEGAAFKSLFCTILKESTVKFAKGENEQ